MLAEGVGEAPKPRGFLGCFVSHRKPNEKVLLTNGLVLAEAAAQGPLVSETRARLPICCQGCSLIKNFWKPWVLRKPGLETEVWHQDLDIVEAHLKFVKSARDVDFKMHLPSVKRRGGAKKGGLTGPRSLVGA